MNVSVDEHRANTSYDPGDSGTETRNPIFTILWHKYIVQLSQHVLPMVLSTVSWARSAAVSDEPISKKHGVSTCVSHYRQRRHMHGVEFSGTPSITLSMFT